MECRTSFPPAGYSSYKLFLTTTAYKIAVVYTTLYNVNSQLPGMNLIDFNLHEIDSYATVDWELVA